VLDYVCKLLLKQGVTKKGEAKQRVMSQGTKEKEIKRRKEAKQKKRQNKRALK
jgi:hypothetical protein